MASFYNTPGVFIEEIPKLPPSVAPVETAIPAFVGYTEIAADIAPDDLLKKPKRIGSMVEFVLYYGSGPSLTVSEVNIDDVNNFKSAVISSAYYMYDSLRLFYANGGGDCYIVSVGKYGAAVDDVQLSLGTDALLKVDEPTLLLFPDAVVLTDDLLANVQTHALAHCADDSRKDRMAILDLKENDPKGVTFRSKIGVQFLSYGAAYTPWLKTNLPKKVTYADIATHIKRNGAAVTLPGLTPDVALQTQITELGKVYADKANIIAKTNLLASPSANLRDRYAVLVAAYNAAKTVSNFQAIMAYVMSIVIKLDDFLEVGNADIITNAALLASVQSPILTTFKPIAQSIVALDKGAKAKWGAGYTTQATAANFTDATWGAGFVAGVVASGILTAATDPENTDLAVNALNPVFDSLTRSYLSLAVGAASAAATNADSALELAFPVYKSILKGVSTYVSNVPPSGAIAGIYASTDRTRGVWKAPANVSLSNVIEPTVTFTKTELDALNVDVTAGKSVNAIRAFFGKGTLVYGARTLAGNDNEWRYVPVRRLFIMVEESVKKATEQFVFEPNDANTWVKVQAMIENFLYNIWRQGALQGAKPEQAFYVAVGLNKTMNPIDILEGRMIVEIGMAAVRPAEFIILQFSHKMAES
nr:phage tail sheath C-terminal domain-containing protein [uncultured Mucilaginibacter sp.]